MTHVRIMIPKHTQSVGSGLKGPSSSLHHYFPFPMEAANWVPSHGNYHAKRNCWQHCCLSFDIWLTERPLSVLCDPPRWFLADKSRCNPGSVWIVQRTPVRPVEMWPVFGQVFVWPIITGHEKVPACFAHHSIYKYRNRLALHTYT